MVSAIIQYHIVGDIESAFEPAERDEMLYRAIVLPGDQGRREGYSVV